jgi:hypothetical protein
VFGQEAVNSGSNDTRFEGIFWIDEILGKVSGTGSAAITTRLARRATRFDCPGQTKLGHYSRFCLLDVPILRLVLNRCPHESGRSSWLLKKFRYLHTHPGC